MKRSGYLSRACPIEGFLSLLTAHETGSTFWEKKEKAQNNLFLMVHISTEALLWNPTPKK